MISPVFLAVAQGFILIIFIKEIMFYLLVCLFHVTMIMQILLGKFEIKSEVGLDPT